jgi:NAD(P)-dependent dehydrogenase (short-subunit alcohol dehydrogenase family)
MTHLVTGAGSGIGAALTRSLHDRGDDLVLLVRNDERAAELAAAYDGARTLVADLADAAGLEQMLAAADLPDTLESLVHAAGVVDLAPVEQIDLAGWQRQLGVNLTAPFLLTRALLPALRRARGTAVFVNSGSGLRANAGWAGYAASKFGLRALADTLRLEEEEHGVRVTSIHPGRVATPMQERVHALEGEEYDPRAWSDPATVADAIRHVIDLPRDSTVPEFVVRPGP